MLNVRRCDDAQATCIAHPNQRKVYTTVVGKLLPNLLLAGFRQPSQPGDSKLVNGAGGNALVVASRQLLDNVIFNPSHIEGGPPVRFCFPPLSAWFLQHIKPREKSSAGSDIDLFEGACWDVNVVTLELSRVFSR